MEHLNHPIQPLHIAKDGCVRFKPNLIIKYLVDQKIIKLNDLADMGCFADEDWEQLAQLMGYSHSGFGSLSYVSDRVYEAALDEYQNRNEKK